MVNKDVSENKEKLQNSSQIQELRISNALLLAENDMLEGFLSRLDPDDLESSDEDPATSAGFQSGSGGQKRRSSRSFASFRPFKLTQDQKVYIVQSEIKATQLDRENLKWRSETVQDNYKVSMEESELCLAEIRKAKKEFEQKMLKPMKDKCLDRKDPKGVLQFLRDKSKDTQLEMLHLKIPALKAEEKKLQHKLQLTKQMGKTEYNEEIIQENIEQETNINPDELRIKSLKVQSVLGSHRDQLQSATMELTGLTNEISNKEQMLVKLEKNIQQAEEECLKAETLNQHLRRQMADYQAPDVTEYMQVKAKHKLLKQSMRTSERKARIAELTWKTHTKASGSQRATLTPANSAAAGARPWGGQ